MSSADKPAPAGAVKQVANWIMVEVAAQLNRDGLDIAAARVGPAQLARLVTRITDGTISGKIARDIFQALWAEADGEPAAQGAQVAQGAPDAVDRIIDEKGLRQISDSSALEPLVEQVLAQNEKSVLEYRAGREKAFNSLVGQVMKASRGKANPQQVNELLRAKLDAS